MFTACNKLTNTSVTPNITYLSYKVDASMANPAGYFTPSGSSDLPGKGTMYDPYRIGTLSQWNTFADDVNGGNDYSGKYVKLTADIGGINTMVGTADHAFAGEFDGDGHVLTVNIESSALYVQHCVGRIISASD